VPSGMRQREVVEERCDGEGRGGGQNIIPACGAGAGAESRFDPGAHGPGGWINLLSNAIKFSPAGPTVDVRVTSSPRPSPWR